MREVAHRCLAVVLVTLTLGATPALAQDDDGIIINPDSPSGVEYDLPLERARRDADPERPAGAPVVQDEQSSVLFGAGIRGPARAKAAGKEPAAGRTQRSGKPAAGRAGGRERRTPLPPEVMAAVARPVAPADGDKAMLLYGAGGALVIAGGALAGLVLRRRRG